MCINNLKDFKPHAKKKKEKNVKKAEVKKENTEKK